MFLITEKQSKALPGPKAEIPVRLKTSAKVEGLIQSSISGVGISCLVALERVAWRNEYQS